ncbi:leucyl/phenylalanyl-tRNA--protein transferase [Aliiglaciecola litoralis]|uniref:Leucyl/phenylalanyl-tRNA--protein transferase n=1 Tax=Aliiglaciecola litoralis TaxID=582857 RepID=A0ABN1LCE4_9ALTE
MISLPKLDAKIAFPNTEQALGDPNGLLAFGGDLSVNRLLHAYQLGIFPWFSAGEPILWWSPDPRGVIYLDDYSSSKSLNKYIRKTKPKVTINHSFNEVIQQCAMIPRTDSGTWITKHMIEAYQQLHIDGHAHSVEVWEQDELVGGLYGVFVKNTFCGESMFSLQSNASKVALHYLIAFLKQYDVPWIDCQMQNPHLQSLGCVTLPRIEFTHALAQQQNNDAICWEPAVIS